MFGVNFIQKSAAALTILSLFLAITQVLNMVMDKLRQIYKGRPNEDHMLFLTIAEDRINVSNKDWVCWLYWLFNATLLF